LRTENAPPALHEFWEFAVRKLYAVQIPDTGQIWPGRILIAFASS